MGGTMELRLFLEPEEKNDLERGGAVRLTELEEKGANLREVLLEKGWTELPSIDGGSDPCG
jgi:hypothetical protein